MLGIGPHRWYFAGRTPWIAKVLFVLLIANSFADPVCFPVYEHFARRPISVPLVAWLDVHFIETQFVLLALLAIVFFIHRKAVRYEDRSAKRK
jgi:hypothetical protein